MTHIFRRTAYLLLLLPAAALAQTQSEPPSAELKEAREKVRAACSADVQKFCAQIERAKGAMRACLDAHESDLSADCRTARAVRSAAKAKGKS
jgi:hypothetical protein